MSNSRLRSCIQQLYICGAGVRQGGWRQRPARHAR